MQYEIRSIKKGIVRISVKEKKRTDYLARYGLLTIPEGEADPELTVGEDYLVLPNGKRLDFSIRPETDDTAWADEIEYELGLFADRVPYGKRIIGEEETELLDIEEDLDRSGRYPCFGIRIGIGEDERFYGLGEGNSESVEHRGRSYQNWAVYQYNEIPIPLVLSSANWGILIAAQDRHFVDIDDRTKGCLTALGNRDDLDVFILYGDSMKDLLARYTDLTGKSMVLPKWAYGLTYIAPIHINQWELMQDMERFRREHIPCDNVSLEPGWMTRFYDYSLDKQWDLSKFHMDFWMNDRDYPYTFLSALRRMGLHTALWSCVRYDLCDEEERRVGGEAKIPAWYEHMGKFAKAGVDGFKLDPADMLTGWQLDHTCTNGQTALEMHNLSQALLPKQVRLGFEEQIGQRPFLHYCGGYLGQQRWGAATTGDNDGGTKTMVWLLNLAMSGFMNTTVDMDVFDVRGIHYAMLAPWAHHNAWMGVAQPWYVGEEQGNAYRFYARLRYRILPYLYSAALECRETGVPMLRAMALEFQNDATCATLSQQYMIGEWLLTAVYTDRIYLPAGEWTDYWTGEVYQGERWIEHYEPPKERGGALFVRGGAILPQWRDRDYTAQYTDEEIELHVWPHESSRTTFYEDDGVSLQYLTEKPCRTEILCEETAQGVTVTIGERVGDYTGKPDVRTWKVTVHGCDRPVKLICQSDRDRAILMTEKGE